jgi:Mg2+ and Co2+ transporter CorA
MKDPAVRQGGMALNLEIRTERLTNSVMSMCETLCSQHEICIQMLERRDYQTVYKVMKKEQRISCMAEMINHQVMELMPLVQPVPATLRRLLVSSHISFELLHMRGSARAAAEFADSCEDEDLRIYVEELERSLILTLRVVIGMYGRNSLDDMKTAVQRVAMTENIISEFTQMTNAESAWPQLTESIRQMLCGIRNICEDVSYLCTGEIKETSELRS